MSFGGSTSAMIASLKNNKISKRDNKLGHLEYVKGVPIGKPLVFKNKISKDQIVAFKEKLRLEKRKSTTRIIVIYSISLIFIGCIVFYYFY